MNNIHKLLYPELYKLDEDLEKIKRCSSKKFIGEIHITTGEDDEEYLILNKEDFVRAYKFIIVDKFYYKGVKCELLDEFLNATQLSMQMIIKLKQIKSPSN